MDIKDKTKGAFVSSCGKYRYTLYRIWDENLPKVLFIMLNPSTADADKDDPTIRRCVAFAKSWGFGSLGVVNLFSYRATNPADLLKADDPTGKDNDKWIRSCIETTDLTVCAWGNAPILKAIQKKYGNNYQPLTEVKGLHYIALSNNGIPKHPLYLRGDLRPKKFESNNVLI